MLQTISLSAEDGSMVCEENLVPHKLRQHPNLNCKDVQWHPQQATQLATGSSSGTVLLWNLEGRVNDKLCRTLTGHSRAVNRVCYVPQEASRLLSGSQDCTVKQWDTRVRFAQQHSYRTAAEVRDVAVSRLSPLSFAVALENGMVQLFDMRHSKGPLQALQAHGAPVFCLDYHPELRGVLATGSRDRLLKVRGLARLRVRARARARARVRARARDRVRARARARARDRDRVRDRARARARARVRVRVRVGVGVRVRVSATGCSR